VLLIVESLHAIQLWLVLISELRRLYEERIGYPTG